MCNLLIEVDVRDVYGKQTYYPRCTFAKMLCELMGQKTLTYSNLQTLKRNGYEVYGIREEIEL